MPVSSSTVVTQMVFVPDMPGILDLLHDDVAGVGGGVRRRQDQIAVRRGIAARLGEHPLAQAVGVIAEIAHLVVHRRAGDIEHAAHDDAPRFAAGVGIDGLHHVGYSHPQRIRMST